MSRDLIWDAEITCPSLVVARFVFCCGHVALQELIHLDVAVFGELKRRRAVSEMENISVGNGKSKAAGRKSISAAASASKSAHRVITSHQFLLVSLQIS